MASQPVQELERRLAAVRAMVESVPDPIVLVGADGLVREANAAASLLLPALRVGQPLSYGLRAPAILDALAGMAPGESVHVEYQQKVPTERTYDVQIAVLAAPAEALSQPLGTMLFFRDLTEARRLERM